ncbi:MULTISPECIES: preprotein translocase subunit SecG [Carboxydothermus]|uniref:Protein-export membrane protein SecG n=2 Tax=Carboxydothermus TaxID=129957 RepID=Q3AFC7_CARHZ|nr:MULTISPECIES: preprotein translocase subunit SecG [Carboxydothermus]ABB15817.1 preprotein translocase, SecG subunit [Carboxydothermus hydrogenoformans Z-2901]NYE57310.1 preprotein translocase subunit SecG [Carboxydothermus ferrireducens DSM 11255]
MAVLKGILVFLHILAALGVIAAVLLQSGKSAGLSGSIAGGAEILFGKKKGLDELFEKMTVVAVILFMILSLVLALLF